MFERFTVEGRRVRELRRVGKRIAVGVEDDLWLVLHLMIAGRLHWRAAGAKLAGRNQLAAFQAGRRVRVPICFDGVRNKCQKFQLRVPQPELLDGSLPIAMHLFMADSTEGDQVLFGVIIAVAAKLLVANLQICSGAARLAAPAVTPQDLLP